MTYGEVFKEFVSVTGIAENAIVTGKQIGRAHV